MCKEFDNGRTRVVNKGVDVAVFAGSSCIGDAMKASRTLVVKGISTAVIEVLAIEPPDEETIISFAEKTGALVFTEQRLYEAFRGLLKKYESVIIEIALDSTPQNIIDTTIKAIKRKLGN